LRELRVFENRLLRRIFGPKRDGVIGSEDNCIMKSLMTCAANKILFA
jgi:hypothetical protein